MLGTPIYYSIAFIRSNFSKQIWKQTMPHQTLCKQRHIHTPNPATFVYESRIKLSASINKSHNKIVNNKKSVMRMSKNIANEKVSINVGQKISLKNPFVKWSHPEGNWHDSIIVAYDLILSCEDNTWVNRVV